MAQFAPFKEEATSVALDEMTIENRVDRIALYGSLQITRDKIGLQLARQLQELLNATVATLEQEDLPERIASKPADRIPNPFD